jgi:hypothetical protein
LMAQAFDAERFKLSGELSPLADQLEILAGEAGVGALGAAFSISPAGLLAYRQAGTVVSELAWLDRNGMRLGTVGGPGDYTNPALSPDEKKLAVSRTDLQTKTRDIWIFDLERGASSRFTFDPADDSIQPGRPMGAELLLRLTNRKGHRDIYQKSADGTGPEELLIEGRRGEQASINDWTPDSKTILFGPIDNIWSFPLDRNRKPSPLFERGFPTRNPQVSPNGRWIAYGSNESGKFEVYVQRFPPSSGKWQISTTGGDEPQWRRDGKELFYLATDNRIMAVDVKAESTDFHAGVPKPPLFEIHGTPARRRNHFVVTANGQRSLAVLPLEQTHSSPITVVTNWMEQLKQ